MLLSWYSTCLFSRRQLGPFALLVLSKSNQTELESNPNSFFSFLEIRLCCFTLVKMLRSSISACIWTNVSSLPQQWGPVLWGALTPQSKHSWGSSLFTFFTSLILHQMARTAMPRLPWMSSAQLQTLFCFQKKLKIISETCTSAGITTATNRNRRSCHWCSGEC